MRGISLKFLPFLCVMCPDVDRGLARAPPRPTAKAPVTGLLPLTATAWRGAARTNPSGETDANLIDTLGSTNSSSNNVHLKPFSTSILSFLNWIIATVTKICTKDHSKPAHADSSPSIFTYFYSFKYQSPQSRETGALVAVWLATWTVLFGLQIWAQSIFRANLLGR